MLQCEKCEHMQRTGKFCGNCGGALVQLTTRENNINDATSESVVINQTKQLPESAVIDKSETIEVD